MNIVPLTSKEGMNFHPYIFILKVLKKVLKMVKSRPDPPHN